MPDAEQDKMHACRSNGMRGGGRTVPPPGRSSGCSHVHTALARFMSGPHSLQHDWPRPACWQSEQQPVCSLQACKAEAVCLHRELLGLPCFENDQDRVLAFHMLLRSKLCYNNLTKTRLCDSLLQMKSVIFLTELIEIKKKNSAWQLCIAKSIAVLLQVGRIQCKQGHPVYMRAWQLDHCMSFKAGACA